MRWVEEGLWGPALNADGALERIFFKTEICTRESTDYGTEVLRRML